MGANARTTVERRFSERAAVDPYLEVLDAIFARRS
jgi:hypothetical protein